MKEFRPKRWGPGAAFITRAGLIAAVYAALTLLFAPISYGLVQVRIAEALCVLPFFTPAAIPGLFAGCVIANLCGGLGVLDVVFGSLATLAAAAATYKIKNKWLAPLPGVLSNGLIMGAVLSAVLEQPFWLAAAYVTAGQLAACYGIGLPLLLMLERYGKRLF